MSISEFVNEANIIQKIDKLAKANKYGTVDGTQMNGETAREIIAMFKHPKMNSHRNQMLKMKSHELVDLSIRLLKPLKIKIESDLGITTKKGKTVKAVHKTSGKEIVVVDTPSSRKKLKRMGFSVKESVNEAPMAYSSPEAKQQLDSDIVSMSKILGKASQQVIKIMMDGVKSGKYDAMDIPRGIETGPLNRTHEGERPFMKMLWRKVRSGFRRYSPKGKLRK